MSGFGGVQSFSGCGTRVSGRAAVTSRWSSTAIASGSAVSESSRRVDSAMPRDAIGPSGWYVRSSASTKRRLASISSCFPSVSYQTRPSQTSKRTFGPHYAGMFGASSSRAVARLASRTAVAGVLLLIRAYKLIISPLFAGSCRFAPSCSSYAAEAVGRHGIMRGGWLAVRRLGRCQPLCPGGYDPVPGSDRSDRALARASVLMAKGS